MIEIRVEMGDRNVSSRISNHVPMKIELLHSRRAQSTRQADKDSYIHVARRKCQQTTGFFSGRELIRILVIVN
jgi:hypothetical protein